MVQIEAWSTPECQEGVPDHESNNEPNHEQNHELWIMNQTMNH